MNVTVINGAMHKGSTYHCVKLLLDELSKKQAFTLDEFFLPRDMPEFCHGCFSCFLNGEETCPHYEWMAPIQASLEQADIIILASPCYGMDVSGQMKALIDHLCYRWLSHRPHPAMFQKIGVALSTTAGAGAKRTAKTMQHCLTYWGLKRVYSFKKAVGAMKPCGINEKNKRIIQKKISRLSNQLLKDLKKGEKQKPRLLTRFLFQVMKKMHNDSNWNPYDRNYWEKHGWFANKKPY